MAFLQHLFFWKFKEPESNKWRPEPGGNPNKHIDNLPTFMKRTDLAATVVDVAPFIAGAGGLAHVSQIHSIGFTVPASVFRNVKTMTAMHRTTLYLTPLVLVCQAIGFQYRDFIPRLAHERELRRDEEGVRKHVDAGMYVGGCIYALRMAFKVGARYWAPIDVVMGGALTGLLQIEYIKAHAL